MNAREIAVLVELENGDVYEAVLTEQQRNLIYNLLSRYGKEPISVRETPLESIYIERTEGTNANMATP